MQLSDQEDINSAVSASLQQNINDVIQPVDTSTVAAGEPMLTIYLMTAYDLIQLVNTSTVAAAESALDKAAPLLDTSLIKELDFIQLQNNKVGLKMMESISQLEDNDVGLNAMGKNVVPTNGSPHEEMEGFTI